MNARRWVAELLGVAVVAGLATVAQSAAAVPARATGCTSTWVGPARGAWTDPANWQPAGVPNHASDVCIVDRPGPTVSRARAHTLYATNTSMHISRNVYVRSGIDVESSTLRGAGSLSGRSATLNGVALSGSLLVRARSMVVTGSRFMCGRELALCLSDVARVAARGLTLHLGDVGGNTSARPTLDLGGLTTSGDAVDGVFRIGVPISAYGVRNAGQTTGPVGLVLSAWRQLDPDGVLSGRVSGSVRIPRTVTAITRYSSLSGPVVTPDGGYAGADLTTNDGTVSIDVPATITPAEGILTSHGPIVVGSHGVAVDGAVQVHRQDTGDALVVAPGATLATTGPVASFGGSVSLAGILRTPRLSLHRTFVDVKSTGKLVVDTLDLRGPYVALEVRGGGTIATSGAAIDLGAATLDNDGGCHSRIEAPLTLTADSVVISRANPDSVGCRQYGIDGPVTLDGRLGIYEAGKFHLGDHLILLHSTMITGRFAKIGGVNNGPNHWEVTYTDKNVEATLVAGNV